MPHGAAPPAPPFRPAPCSSSNSPGFNYSPQPLRLFLGRGWNLLRRDRQERAAEPPAPVGTPRAGLSGVLPAVTGDSRTPAQPGLQFCQKSVFSEAEGAQVQFGPSGLWFAPPPPHTDLTQTPSASCAGDTEQPNGVTPALSPTPNPTAPHPTPPHTPRAPAKPSLAPQSPHFDLFHSISTQDPHKFPPHTLCRVFAEPSFSPTPIPVQ